MSKITKITTEDCGNRSVCALSNTLDILGDKWTLLIVRDMFCTGKSQFGDFLESPEGISTTILTDRLKKLERFGIITKRPYQSNPVRYEYILTDTGLDLVPIMENIGSWGLQHIEGTMRPTEEQQAALREYYRTRSKSA